MDPIVLGVKQATVTMAKTTKRTQYDICDAAVEYNNTLVVVVI